MTANHMTISANSIEKARILIRNQLRKIMEFNPSDPQMGRILYRHKEGI